MTQMPEEWFINASEPWRGVHRRISTDCTVSMETWLNLQEIISYGRKTGFSQRVFWPKVIVSCGWCKKSMVKHAYDMQKAWKRGGESMYCGRSCNTQAANHKKWGEYNKNCPICGKRKPNLAAKYCGPTCVETARQTRKEEHLPSRPCEVCGKTFRPQTTTQPGRFCSKPCKNLAHSREMAGAYNPAWREGADAKRAAYAKEIIALRPVVRERDGNKCVVCETQHKLQMHHIDLDASNQDMANLVTLCKTCHEAFHAGDRSKPKKILYPWLNEYTSRFSSMTSK
jgi:endogenous inhibitor of DNA gyrase (YacG/DUF329 family)